MNKQETIKEPITTYIGYGGYPFQIKEGDVFTEEHTHSLRNVFNQALQKQREEIVEMLKKKKMYDPWEYPFNNDRTWGYNKFLDEAIQAINNLDKE